MPSEAQETSQDDLSAELAHYGLTPNQAETYIALTKSSWTSALELAKVVGKHHEEVYRSLDKLRELGLVSVMPGRPTRYLALSPEQGLSLLIDRESQRLQDLKSRKRKLAEKLESLRLEQKTIPEQKGFRWVADDAVSANMLVGVIKEAKYKVSLTVRSRELETTLSGSVSKALLDAQKRGVEVEILTRVTPENAEAVQTLAKHFRVKHRGMIPAGLGLFDQSNARLVFHSGEEEQGPDMIEIWSGNKRFVDCILSLFSELWDSSLESNVAIELIKVGSQIPHLQLLNDRHTALDMIHELADQAENQIYVLANSKYLREVLSALEKSEKVTRGHLKVFVLTQINDNNSSLIQEYGKYDFTFRHSPNVNLVGAASTSRVVVLPEPDILNEGFCLTTGAHAVALGRLFKELFDRTEVPK